MRRVLWPLIFSLLLQLLAGSAWARTMGVAQPGHCHDAAASQVDAFDAVQAPAQPPLTDGHHCCAVGLGWLEPALQSPPPQAAPAAVPDFWLSLALRPDLRPPI